MQICKVAHPIRKLTNHILHTMRQNHTNTHTDEPNHLDQPTPHRSRLGRLLRKWGAWLMAGVLVAGLGRYISTSKNYDTTRAVTSTQTIDNQSLVQQVATPDNTLATAAIPVEGSGAAWRRDAWPCAKATFDAGKGVTYRNPKTGTTVSIPASSLVHADGSPVSGEVELQLREYRTVGEYISSGIDLHYADSRGDFFFNSGGMFDVQVLQGNERLQLAENQSATVNFVPTNALENASLYYFDEATNQWEVSSTTAFGGTATEDGLPAIVNEQTVARNNGGTPASTCLPDPSYAHMGCASWVQPGIKSGYELAFGKVKMPKWFQKHACKPDSFVLSAIERSTVRLERRKDGEHMFFIEEPGSFFKELSVFKGTYFKAHQDSVLGESPLKINDSDLRTSWWRVIVTPGVGNRCLVTFTGQRGILKFEGTLLPSTPNSKFDAQKVFAEYTRIRNERRAAIAAELLQWRQMVSVADAFKTEQEWCMDDTTWIKYFFDNQSLMRKRYADLVENQGLADSPEASNAVWVSWCQKVRDMGLSPTMGRRSFGASSLVSLGPPKPRPAWYQALTISNFGLHNCDQIFRLEGRKYVSNAFRDPAGELIKPARTVLIDKTQKICVTQGNPNALIITNRKNIDIVVTDQNKRTYYFSAEQYSKLDQDKPMAVMQDVTTTATNPEDWKRLLGL
jgi:hypothetical protein